jgi:DNA polymerase elongation subunit (family B)
MKKESDPFMKNILDKRQLSIKVTANSLYGQTGAKTSTFYEMDVAASTTATGRKLLHYARDVIEGVYNNKTIDTKHGGMITNAEYIYGDTDSVFFTFNLKDEHGEPVRGQKALEVTIELAKEAGHLATQYLKKPHDLEYEKTFMPFCLLSKKRYVGMLYEEDPHYCKRKSMGIVLKRRDNAPIVKDVYGGIIDILMKEKDINKSISFLENMLNDIVNQKIPMHKLIISKSLRSFYKNPKQIAHKVLADRMGQRDPGNKPGPGDRIPYVYILTSKKKDLQGNKIENPDYIKEKKLKIDYGFYITNQIMKPVLQIYSLVLNEMPQFSKRKKMFQRMIKRLQEEADDHDKFQKKVQQLKDKEVEKILFEKYLIINKNKANNNTMITSFFQ